MKRMILVTLLIGFLMGSVVLATCQRSAHMSADPNDPNAPQQEMGLPTSPIIWLAAAADPNDPNAGGEE